MRGLGILLVGLLVLLAATARADVAFCFVPDCCYDRFIQEQDLQDAALALAEVSEVRAGGISVSLLQMPIYCVGGIACSPADFPGELILPGTSPCGLGAWEVDTFQVGDVAIFLVDQASGCLLAAMPTDAEGAVCKQQTLLPLGFALAQGLRPEDECRTTSQAAGYYLCDDPDSNGGCVQTAGGSGGLGTLALMGMGWLTFRRRRT
ncbi:MAG TPA: MYXO-CTERM sorting domain-containing protein [Myxococcota bacterium]|nr:MYXO-CTERM sorting domain-containing protein [Myxococcota bacterium]HRY96093.1 MYXO-CTERM sorting domain-containing protein [Myxococcota bacterium]